MRTLATRDPTSQAKKQGHNRIALTSAPQLGAETSGHGTSGRRSAMSRVGTQRRKQIPERCLATDFVDQVGKYLLCFPISQLDHSRIIQITVRMVSYCMIRQLHLLICFLLRLHHRKKDSLPWKWHWTTQKGREPTGLRWTLRLS